MKKKSNLYADIEMRRVLKRYDPVMPPNQATLAALAADILAQVDAPSRQPVLSYADVYLPAWMHYQSWTTKMATMVVMLIVVSGFLVGHVLYAQIEATSYADVPTFMASADAGNAATLPAALWGDNDDDGQ